MQIKRPTLKAQGTKRILIVNCYLDDSRQPIPRTHKIPPAMGPAYLAGAFSHKLCEVRLYNEQHSGPLEDERLLAWPDMLVLTGLNASFDRMLHLTAYARTKNEKVIVVTGGPPIRALPRYCQRFFDYCCLGDIEQLQEVIADAFGKAYVAEEMIPRFDLAYWVGKISYVESSRYCNFHCGFCALTAEGRGYQQYSLAYLRRQILAAGKKWHLFFIDNNFYGNDRNYFLARLELLREMRREGHFKHWGALVTNDFFLKDENLELARESGCIVLFSGVESFDPDWLRSMHKTQNTHAPQVEMISKCLKAGIVFLYPLMLDTSSRHIDDLHRELDFITRTPDITLPSFVTLTIPMLNTPYFYDCLAQGLILPQTKLRDLNSQTISTRPLDPLDQVVHFAREIQTLSRYRERILKHAWTFLRKYRSYLTYDQLGIALVNAVYLAGHHLITAPGWLARLHRPTAQRTYVSTTDILDPVYKPAFPVASRYEHYFKPTMLTDKAGQLTEELAEDLGDPRRSDRRVASG